jgi:uncharacterized protein (TIGR02145 family)
MNKISKLFTIMFAFAAITVSCSKNDDLSTIDEGIVINGIKWATRNVDDFGHFAATPEATGKFYQWNRPTAWAATGNVTAWNNSAPDGENWKTTNDPSPNGWRVPTSDEVQSLLNSDKVSNEWTTQNGVNGRLFTDKATSATLFLPAAGGRNFIDGKLNYAGAEGDYWSSTAFNSRLANFLLFYSGDATAVKFDNRNGFSVRSVAK